MDISARIHWFLRFPLSAVSSLFIFLFVCFTLVRYPLVWARPSVIGDLKQRSGKIVQERLQVDILVGHRLVHAFFTGYGDSPRLALLSLPFRLMVMCNYHYRFDIPQRMWGFYPYQELCVVE